LFEIIASEFFGAFGANNAKSGTCVAEAAKRLKLVVIARLVGG
jgi:hypothetical protein